MSLHSELSINPVKELEVTFVNLVKEELDIAHSCATIYFEENYIATPSANKTKTELEKAQSNIRAELLNSIGELFNKDVYTYLLVVKEWIIELSLAKNNILDNEWYQLDSASKIVRETFDSNLKIIKSAFQSELFKIYENAINDLDKFHLSLLEKYDEGKLTDQTPKEIAEHKLTFSPVFIISEDMKLSTMKGKESTTNLDKYQTALLFDLLRKKGAIINLKNSSLAHVISRLSPHSEQNLRTEGLDVIDFIKVDNPSYKNKNINIPNQNLQAVKEVLTSILEEIDEQIKTNSEKK